MSKRSNDRDLRKLQKQQQNQVQQRGPQTIIAQHSELRIAPLPTSEELAGFEQVLPGLAERIVRMAELNGQDRRSNNRAIRWATILGQVFAFIIVISALGAGFYLVTEGLDVAGVATILTAIGVPLGVFAYNHSKHRS